MHPNQNLAFSWECCFPKKASYMVVIHFFLQLSGYRANPYSSSSLSDHSPLFLPPNKAAPNFTSSDPNTTVPHCNISRDFSSIHMFQLHPCLESWPFLMYPEVKSQPLWDRNLTLDPPPRKPGLSNLSHLCCFFSCDISNHSGHHVSLQNNYRQYFDQQVYFLSLYSLNLQLEAPVYMLRSF